MASALWRTVPRGVALVALAVLALNSLDMVFTLRHVELGAIEVNPLMRELLEEGLLPFALGKHLMVGACLVAVVGQAQSPLATGALRYVVLPVYMLTALYHFALFGLT